ncbi:MAG: hypothetical protein IJ168_07130 [Eubacterium sp.]|nr:hypothetical protein [Eubacterium sp.]
MNKKDYLDEATKKIYRAAAAKAVAEELGSHIDEKTALYEQRELPPDTAADRALEDMGEAALVADSFAELHNDFYNPLPDIVTLLLHLGLLAAGYYAVSRFAAPDPGLFSLMPALLAMSLSLMLGDAALCLKRCQLIPSLFSLIRLAGTAFFQYFTVAAIDRVASSDPALLWQRLFTPLMAKAASQFNRQAVVITVAVLTLLELTGVAVALALEIKTRRLTVKSADNRRRRLALRLTRYFALLFAAVTLIFTAKLYFDAKAFQREYLQAYQTLLDMTEQCETADGVDQFIRNSKLDFEQTYDYNGEFTGYRYQQNYTALSVAVTFDEPIQVRDVYDALAQSLERDETGYIYEVTLGVDASMFTEGMDALSLRWLHFDENAILAYHETDFSALSLQALYQRCCQYVPVTASAVWSTQTMWDREATFEYLFSENEFKYRQKETVRFPTETADWLSSEVKRILKVVKENPEVTGQALADLIDAEYRTVTVDLSSYFSEELIPPALSGKLDIPVYYLNDEVYMIYDVEESYGALAIYAGDELLDFRVLDIYNSSGERAYGKYREEDTRTGEDVFRKVAAHGYFYDRDGRCYDNVRYVPYFTRDGTPYFFYSTITKTESKDEYDIKNYYLTDRHGTFYDARQCYIDADGYLTVDSQNMYTKGDGAFYVTPAGGQVTKALYTSWDNDGSFLSYDTAYENEVVL